METLKIVAAALAGAGVVMGVITLFAAWFAPGLLATPFMRWMTTGPRLKPDRQNQSLMAVWSILLGTYILLAVAGQTILGLAVFALWLPVAAVVLGRSFWPNRKA